MNERAVHEWSLLGPDENQWQGNEEVGVCQAQFAFQTLFINLFMTKQFQ